MLNTQSAHSRLKVIAKATRNDTHIATVLYGVSKRIAILSIVATDKVAAVDRNNLTVGHNAINIEDEGLDIG
jgi:hypothetical protein